MHKIPSITLILTIFLTAANSHTQAVNFVNFTAEEKRRGEEFMEEINSQVSLVKDDITNDYIQKLGAKLVPEKNYHFFIINDDSINALAGPAGYIGINSGTMGAVESEDELAAILAHEVAHGTQHHLERLVNSTKNTKLIATASMLAAALIGTNSHSNAANQIASGISLASLGGMAQQTINFTREHEIEADNIGIKILHTAKFNPHAMVTLFERMQHRNLSSPSEIPKFLLTHPLTEDRIANAKNRADLHGVTKNTPSLAFSLVRARIQMLTTKFPMELEKYFRHGLNRHCSSNCIANHYGYALALMARGKIQESQEIVDKLLLAKPSEPLFKMLEAELEMKNKNIAEALAVLKSSMDNSQNYDPLVKQYIRTLLVAKKYPAALTIIQKQLWQRNNDADLYFFLAEVQSSSKQIAEAHISRAQAYIIMNRLNQANTLLKQALKIPNLTSDERDIINAKIIQLKNTSTKR